MQAALGYKTSIAQTDDARLARRILRIAEGNRPVTDGKHPVVDCTVGGDGPQADFDPRRARVDQPGTATLLSRDVADKRPKFYRSAYFQLQLSELARCQHEILVAKQVFHQRWAEPEPDLVQICEDFFHIAVQVIRQGESLMKLVSPFDQRIMTGILRKHRGNGTQQGCQ